MPPRRTCGSAGARRAAHDVRRVGAVYSGMISRDHGRRLASAGEGHASAGEGRRIGTAPAFASASYALQFAGKAFLN
jgi:hypothetical protein